MSTLHVNLALAALLLAACTREPAWKTLPAGALAGESTVAGTPAPVRRLTVAPTIDGKLDEPGWAAATALGPLVDPGMGEADRSTLAGTFVRAAWDDRALYLGFVVPDKAPDAPFGPAETDPHLWERASAVEVMLQPGDPGDNREYFEMQYDTAGAAFDTRWDDYNAPITDGPAGKVFGHQDWSSQAVRKAVVAGRGYSLELAIPWTALSSSRVAVPPRPGDVWRLNLYAFRDGQRVANAWSPLQRQGNFHRASRFGRIRFE